MAFIQLAPEQPADHLVTELFAADQETSGYVANATRLFAHRPTVYVAWEQLNAAIKANMDLRRYQLATLAAARRLRSSYCALAHGKVLRDRFYDAATVRAIVTDHHHAGLDPVDVAVMDFLDVALAAAVRCFFSKVLDAMGVEPDAAYRSLLEPDLREALTVGRPLAPVAPAGSRR
jgi:alkylhydroperoxidase family enzyme